MDINNPKLLAAQMYRNIYPRSQFYDRSSTDQRTWIEAVQTLGKAIIADVLEQFNECPNLFEQNDDNMTR